MLSMVRLAGAVLLAAGPAVTGFCAAGRLARRPVLLRELAAALEQMEREISFRLTPLPELFAGLSRTCEGPVGALFAGCAREMEHLGRQPMARIWRQALEEADLDLTDRGLRAMEELGEVLGRYDGEGLLAALGQARSELAAAEAAAREELERKGRMEQVLGLTAGGLLAILLI